MFGVQYAVFSVEFLTFRESLGIVATEMYPFYSIVATLVSTVLAVYGLAN